MHHRLPRIVGALGVATTLVAGSVGSALSSTAPLIVTGANYSPVVVSYGGIGVFHVKAENDPTQTSNISQLYLRENSQATVYGYADPAPNPWCSSVGQPLTCSFGSLSPGQSVEFTVALTAPSSGSTWNVDFEFSTNGFAPGKPSRGGGTSDFHYTVSIPLASTSDTSNAAGTYIWDTTQQSSPVHNGLKLGQGNPQATSVTSPSTGIAVSVQDGDSNVSDLGCTDTAGAPHPCSVSFFGQISIIEVGGDELVTDPAQCMDPAVWVPASATSTNVAGCAFPAVIQYYRPGINPNQVNGVYHNWTDSSGFHQEWIDTECASAGAPGPVAPCFYAEKLGAQNLQITIWFFHNGRVMTW